MIALLALARVAAAEPFVGQAPAMDAGSVRPSLDSVGLVWTDDTRVAPAGGALRVLLTDADDPLVYRTAQGQRFDVIGQVLQLDLMPQLRFWRVRLGADLPFYPLAVVEGSERLGWGDARLDARLVVLDGARAPLGLAVAGGLGLPTGVLDGLRAEALTGDARLVLDRAAGPHRVALNVGAHAMPSVQLEGLTVGSALTGRLGYSLALDPWLPVSAGVGAELLGQQPWGAALTDPGALQLEWMLSGWLRRGPIVLRAGGGAGLSHGVGVADTRLVLGFGVEPPDGPPDRDGDGVPNRVDGCPRDPEDADGVDDSDGCPELKGPEVR